MKKRIVSLLLTVAMVMSVCCLFATAASGDCGRSWDCERYCYYDRFTADVSVSASGLCCTSKDGSTLTAYVSGSTDKAVIDVDTVGRCSVKVTDNGSAVSGKNGQYTVSLDKGWNTFKVVVSANRYYICNSPWWVYQAPVVDQKPDVKPDAKPDAQPEQSQLTANSVRPVYVQWKPTYRTESYSNTYYVKIYRGDAPTCGHTCDHYSCRYDNCGKHGCKLHSCYDLGTTASSTYTITAITNEGGGVSCDDAKFTSNKVVKYLTVSVESGTSAAINIVPLTGYTIGKITVDGQVLATNTLKYTFSDITADHTIAVEFAPIG